MKVHAPTSIRQALPGDAASITVIYNPYIRDTTISFEEEPVTAAAMRERIVSVTRRFPWLVWEEQAEVLGYAYASPWKERSAYRHACETSIYLAPHARGRGIGRALYTALLDELAARGMEVAIGGIALPNPASVALHERLGFRKVAHFDRVGVKFGRHIDVGYWQYHLARSDRDASSTHGANPLEVESDGMRAPTPPDHAER